MISTKLLIFFDKKMYVEGILDKYFPTLLTLNNLNYHCMLCVN